MLTPVVILKSDTKSNSNKRRINKWDDIKLKSSANKGNHQHNEKQPTEWGKLLIKNISDKGITSKIYKDIIQLNSKRIKKADLKMGKNPQ